MLSVFERAFEKRKFNFASQVERTRSTRNRYTGQRSTSGNEKAGEVGAEVLGAVQQVVNSLTSPEGGRFRVTLVDNPAFPGLTSYKERAIKITAKPFFDPNLRLREVAQVITGITVHEIGHVNWSCDGRKDAINETFPGSKLAQMLGILLEDVRTERLDVQRWPGLAEALRDARLWVATSQGYAEAKPLRFTPDLDINQRFNFAAISTLYARFVRWIGDPITRAERLWWQSWADEFTADDSIATHLRGIAVGLERIQSGYDAAHPEQGTTPGEGNDEPVEEPEPESDLGQPDEDEDEDDSDGEGKGEGDEDGDDPFDIDPLDSDEQGEGNPFDDDTAEGGDDGIEEYDPEPSESGEGETNEGGDLLGGDIPDDDLMEPGDEPGDESTEGMESLNPESDEDEGEGETDEPYTVDEDTEVGVNDGDPEEDEFNQEGTPDSAIGEDQTESWDHEVNEDERTGDTPELSYKDTGEDIDPSQIVKTLDDVNDKVDGWSDEYRQSLLGTAINEDLKIERVRSRDGWGTMKVGVDW